jgi:hypothetical protein
VSVALPLLRRAFLADYVVVGGGNAKKLHEVPDGVRRGHNLTAFRGGFRLWGVESVPVLLPDQSRAAPPPKPFAEWRCV